MGTSRVRLARLPTPAQPARSGALRDAWEALSAEIRSCRQCPLGAIRKNAVVYRGSLRPRVVFVGEAPGAEEDRVGAPFVGRSGARLDAAIARLPLTENEYGILNVLKCRPPRNRFDPAAARTCRPYLERQLGLLSPATLVPLGRVALRALVPDAPPILAASGRPLPGRSAAVFPLLHPAAALRSRRWAERWERDVTALGEWLASGTKTPYAIGACAPRANGSTVPAGRLVPGG